MKINKVYKIGIIIFLFVSFTGSLAVLKYLQRIQQPNVILITIDALRPDHLGCYGYKRNTSPNIDKLAKGGAIFTQTISQAPYTLASVASFISSSSPYKHLYLTNLREHYLYNLYMNPAVSSLPGILNQVGYMTALFNDQPMLNRCRGIREDFNTISEINQNNPKEITQLALRWLRKNQNKRFFLWLYYFGAHGAYKPSSPYSDIFFRDGLPKIDKHIPFAMEDMKDIFGVIPKGIAEDNITDVNYYISKYDGKIRVVDEQIGVILGELEKLSLDKKSLIILMSDHGEGLGEHNYYFLHGHTLYDELIRVPLIIKYPPLIHKNTIIDYQVRLIDMVPTIVDILNVNKKSRIKGMDGISLRPYISGRKDYVRQYAFSSIGDIFFSIRTEDWKLIFSDLKKINESPRLSHQYKDNYPDEYQLYNLKNDPGEARNIFDKEQEIFKNLKEKLDRYIFNTMQFNLPREIYKNRASELLDEEGERTLKSLGYIQ